MLARVLNSPHRGLLQNIFALYGVHFARYLFPLITVPYLARVLGPAGWGLVAFVQAFGQYLALVVEYGFSLSATREAARSRESLERRSQLIAGVLGAKAVLAALTCGLAVLVSYWVPTFREHPDIFWAGVFGSLASAFNVMWYFQGLERMGLVAALDVAAKSVVLVGTFVWVRGPGDGWIVLVLTGVASSISTLIALTLAYREVPLRLPSWEYVREALRSGWATFLFRSAVSLYTIGNVFILGLFAAPEIVSYYAGAEKISKAFLGLLGPVSQSFYPRVSHLVRHSKAAAASLARVSLALMGFAGLIMGFAVYVLAPFLVHVLLGEAYEPTIPVVRVLSFLPPLIALSNVLGIQWMLPLGLDRLMNAIILGAGLVNLTLAVQLAPRFAHVGMAWSVVVSEAFVTLAMYLLLRKRDLDPLTVWKQERRRRFVA